MKEFYKYFIVGILASVLDIFTFTTLAWGGGNYLFANVVSTCLGLLFNYYFSCTWVFRQKKINMKRDFLPFATIGLLGMGIQCALLYILIDLKLAILCTNFVFKPFGFTFDMKPVYFFSKVFVTGVTFLWNFFLRKYLVFRRAEKKKLILIQGRQHDSRTITNDNYVDAHA